MAWKFKWDILSLFSNTVFKSSVFSAIISTTTFKDNCYDEHSSVITVLCIFDPKIAKIAFFQGGNIYTHAFFIGSPTWLKFWDALRFKAMLCACAFAMMTVAISLPLSWDNHNSLVSYFIYEAQASQFLFWSGFLKREKWVRVIRFKSLIVVVLQQQTLLLLKISQWSVKVKVSQYHKLNMSLFGTFCFDYSKKWKINEKCLILISNVFQKNG